MASGFAKKSRESKLRSKVKGHMEEIHAKEHKVPIKLDIRFLKNIIVYFANVECGKVTFKSITYIYKFLERIDTKAFIDNDEILIRYNFIYEMADYIVNERRSICNKEDLIFHLQETYSTGDDSDRYGKLIDIIIHEDKPKYELLEATITAVTDRLNFIHLDMYRETVMKVFKDLELNNYDNYREINDQLKIILTNLLTEIRNANNMGEDNNSFSLNPETVKATIVDVVQRMRDSGRVLKTGNKRLNEMLSPGFMGGKLYLYAGVPNAGKTYILVKNLVDIKRYNPDIKVKRQGARPTAFLLTMEDNMADVVGRVLSFIRPGVEKEIKDTDDGRLADLITELVRSKELCLSTDDDLDIVIKYYPNMGIETADIYGLIEEIQDDNREVVCLLMDYVKRIKCSAYTGGRMEENEQLKHVTNELRTIGQHFDIPIISAAQMNREAMKMIESAQNSNKRNSALAVGAGQIGSSYAMVENADCVIIINKETEDTTEEKRGFMTFKRVKLRYRDEFGIEYFITPKDEYGILVDDIDLEKGKYKSKLLNEDSEGNIAKIEMNVQLPEIPNDIDKMSFGGVSMDVLANLNMANKIS